jgi:hypothetical protein
MRKLRLPNLGGIFFKMQKKPYKDYSGLKIDYLTFINKIENSKKTKWLLICECGKECIKRPDHLFDKRGFKSCGCSINKFKIKKNLKHLAINKIFNSYKNGAKKRNLLIEITIKDFEEIIKKNCHYCGITPSGKIKINNEFFLYNGVDRKNSSLGYLKENIVPCCFVCNRGKSNMNYEEFIKYLNRVKNFNN